MNNNSSQPKSKGRRPKEIHTDFSNLPIPKYPKFNFEVNPTGYYRSRLGKIITPHGEVETPNFIFCGTRATVKGVSSEQLREAGSQFVLANTYHLLISPGTETIEKMGKLGKFMNWPGPTLTDSGGYQVFAMGFGSVSDEVKGRRSGNATILKITEEGVKFRSYLDGRIIFLGPEESIQAQRQIGADFIVQFDECTPYHVTREYTEKSTELSGRWGDRSLAEFIRGDDGSQAIYGVIQGGVYEDLRVRSAEMVNGRPFFGTAIGGCLGKTAEEMRRVVSFTAPLLEPSRPIHLLGIGTVEDILHGVLQGVDTFDCVHPTRLARHAAMIMPGVRGNFINLRNAKYKHDDSPLDENCPLELSKTYTKGYIHHLFRNDEMLGPHLLTRHNIAQMNRLMSDIRKGLTHGTFHDVKEFWLGEAK